MSAVLDIQEPGAVAGLGDAFPQDAHPLPRRATGERWLHEFAAAGIHCYVVLEDESLVGFAAVRGPEFLHFGVAMDRRGREGTAQAAHDAVLSLLRSRGVQRA